MSNLENLISKIVADSKEKASVITDEANDQAKKIIDELVAAGNKEKDELLAAGKAEAAKTKDLILTKKRIEIRDGKLSAKQGLIQKVFAAAVKKLNQLPLSQYEAFLGSYLSQMALDGNETLIVPKQYKGLNLAALNEKLSKKGKPINLSLDQGQNNREIKGGFILLKEGVLNNNTFEALIDYYRDDLEKIVSDSLF